LERSSAAVRSAEDECRLISKIMEIVRSGGQEFLGIETGSMRLARRIIYWAERILSEFYLRNPKYFPLRWMLQLFLKYATYEGKLIEKKLNKNKEWG
jgi:hypothetical protein